ncbi:hypothetical protein OP10G_2148 [Fimbriimonas ginsengisoli Gsoil 348]|uniref:Uncharacterized protein n=2 Tax=Fimbriimonas ginsengisoli TaxID=1005039 RepID=A0A068NQ23_FIMGI|nr:hypothetical protein OP10G_2148 [Fimbriimonas ginsengisoli Gsoil 348]
MVAGYTLAMKQALSGSDVKKRLKRVFLDSKFDPDCDPRAANLVYGGALVMLIGFIALAYFIGPAIIEGFRRGNR